jgi:hypothetical protein
MAETQIEWTDATWNPVAGCTIVSAGCTNCYAMEMARRLQAILHQNSSSQAHFGRSGLHMLAYDPSETDSMLYVFDEAGRAQAKKQLHDDIPRYIANYGDTIGVGDFYAGIYNATPAHMLDINSAIIENPDLEVITEDGGERRKANTIRIGDTLRMKNQRSFFPMFFDDQTKKK